MEEILQPQDEQMGWVMETDRRSQRPEECSTVLENCRGPGLRSRGLRSALFQPICRNVFPGERKSHSVMEVEGVNETSFAETCIMANVVRICCLKRNANSSVLTVPLFPQPSTSGCCQVGCGEGFVANVP